MDLREVFAANLRRLRHAKGLSQDDLAYKAEVSRSYLSQLEKGAFYASLKMVGKLAAVLEVEPAELLRDPGSKSGRRKLYSWPCGAPIQNRLPKAINVPSEHGELLYVGLDFL